MNFCHQPRFNITYLALIHLEGKAGLGILFFCGAKDPSQVDPQNDKNMMGNSIDNDQDIGSL
jgi:hypothetical protein